MVQLNEETNTVLKTSFRPLLHQVLLVRFQSGIKIKTRIKSYVKIGLHPTVLKYAHCREYNENLTLLRNIRFKVIGVNVSRASALLVSSNV